jgi:predicted permease
MSDVGDRDDRVPAWRRYLRFWRPDPRRDVDEEIAFHIESLVVQLTAGGMSEPEARRVAQRRFGDITTIAGDMLALANERERTMQRADWFDAIARDARYAARQIIHRPGFTTVVIATLALAIGANTAIFSAVDAVILRPLPAAGLDRLHMVKMNLPGIGLMDTELSPGQTEDLFNLDVVEAGAGYAGASLVLNGVGEARRLSSVRTLGQFFAITGARAQMGRLYRPQESDEGSHRVVVLSHAAWQQVFGGDSTIVGRSVDLNGARFEVIGVMAADAGFPRSADIWVPLMMNTARRTDPAERGRLYVNAVLRVRPGTTGEELKAALDREAVRIQREYQRSTTDFTVTPFVSFLAGELRPVLLVLLGAVGLVLLIACANVGSIQLVRASARAREMAVRSALGAGRGAIVRQLLVEALVLALAGAAVGLLLGKLTIGILGRVASERYPQLAAAQLDGATLLFTLAVTLVAGLLFGLLPALRAARMNLNETLKSGGGRGGSSGRQQHRLLEGSIVVQVALTLMLLLGSVLTVRSFERLLAVDPGFRSQGVFTAKISVPGSKYRSVRLVDAMQTIVERSAAIPGVHAAAAVFGLPFSGDNDSSPFEIVDQPKREGDPERHAEYRVVSGDYFRAMGIPVLRGRVFTPADRGGAPNVVLIDERLARQYFGDADPVGRSVTHLGSPTGNVWTIAGVVGAVMRNELGEEHKATIYYHLPQVPWYSQMALVLRSDLPPAQLAGPLRAAVREFDADIPVHDLRPMQARVESSVGARRLATIVMSGFALLSFALAVLGVYGVISYGTAQRTREIGIRMALGARPNAVSRMVLGSGVAVAAVGIVVGLLLFVAAGKVLEAVLFGVGARDPVTMIGGATVVALAAAIASYLPARRAARVDPLKALRAE